MNWKSLLFVLAATLVLVAGCAAPKAPAPAAPAPAPSAPSAPSGGEGAMMAASVSITDIPETVVIGKPIDVKWSVSGKGAAETAVVYSTKSSGDAAPTKDMYKSMSPRPALSADLPGDFETSFVMGELISVYVRAYATVDGTTSWSDEEVVQVTVK